MTVCTPLWFFWILFPMIPASPTQLFYSLGLGFGASVTLGTMVLLALYGVACVLFGHAVKAKY